MKHSIANAALLVAMALEANSARAQTPPSPAPAASPASSSGEPAAKADLAAQARDPTGSLTLFQITFRWIDSFHNIDGADQAGLTLQPIIPWRIGKQASIARVSASIVTNSPALNTAQPPPDLPPPNQIPKGEVNGLQDTAVVNVFVWRTKWGSYGVGPVMSLPTATNSQLGSGKWLLGPAGVVMLRGKKLSGGLLAQGFFSVAGDADRPDVDVIALQPFGGLDLGGNWSLGLSEINISYDTRGGKWTSVPFGLRLEKFVKLGKLPARIYGEAEYNLLDSQVAPRWTFRFTFAPLL